MKVLHVSTRFFPFVGGVESLVRDICAYGSSDIEFVVTFPDILGHFPEHYLVDDFWVKPFQIKEDLRTKLHAGLKPSEWDALRILGDCKKFIKDETPDIVHIHGSNEISIPMAIAAISTNTAFVTHIHGEYRTEKRPSDIQKLIELSKIVIYVSREAMDANQDLHEREKKVFLLRNAVKDSGMEFKKPSELDNKVILLAGRLEDEKGFDIAIRAFALVCKESEEGVLQIAGNGSKRGELEELVAQLGLENRVEFLGTLPRSDLQRRIADSYCVVVPSKRVEGFSLLAAEAAMLNRPVIASGVGGLNSTIVHLETGVLVEPNRPTKLAESILKVVQDSTYADRLGNQAIKRARVEFEFGRYMEHLSDIYQFTKFKL